MKLALILGALAKLEGSYAAGGTVSTATDGLLLAELADLNEDFAHDGSRAKPPGTSGNLPNVAPAGSFVETTLKAEPRGFGAAYSASNLPPEHVMMRIAGHDAAITLTGGLEKVVYTPTPGDSTFASALLGLYSRGSLWMLKGAYADWVWGADGPKVPLSEYAIKALFTSVADASVPSITYPASAVQSPVAANIAFTIGGVSTLVVKKFQFKKNRSLSPRLDMNSGGHAGFAVGRRGPTLEVTIEEPATATYDARAKRRSAVSEALSLTIGSVQYNRDKLTAPAAQLISVKPSTEETTATLDLVYQLNPSAVGLNDEYARTFD